MHNKLSIVDTLMLELPAATPKKARKALRALYEKRFGEPVRVANGLCVRRGLKGEQICVVPDSDSTFSVVECAGSIVNFIANRIEKKLVHTAIDNHARHHSHTYAPLDLDAPWRMGPVSEAFRSPFVKAGVKGKWVSELTQGQAADLISAGYLKMAREKRANEPTTDPKKEAA